MKIDDLGWKLKILAENGCLGERLGRRWEANRPLAATILAPWGHFGGSWGVFGIPLGALGATLGGQKATREAPRRVTGPFGGPRGPMRVPKSVKNRILGSWDPKGPPGGPLEASN